MDITAVELGPHRCALVRAHWDDAQVRVSAFDPLDVDLTARRPAETAELLRRARRRGHFPRSVTAVVWGLHPAATPEDAGTQGKLAPLVRAGFRVDGVVTPAEALILLARRRTPEEHDEHEGATAWLAVNRDRIAAAVVRAGQLHYAREFEWQYRPAGGDRDELLQRYSLVVRLAEELRHCSADLWRERISIETVVACGNLPDLRSLSMALVEELDVEVETLDELNGIELSPSLRDELRDDVPGIWLACAAAAHAPGPRIRGWPRVIFDPLMQPRD